MMFMSISRRINIRENHTLRTQDRTYTTHHKGRTYAVEWVAKIKRELYLRTKIYNEKNIFEQTKPFVYYVCGGRINWKVQVEIKMVNLVINGVFSILRMLEWKTWKGRKMNFHKKKNIHKHFIQWSSFSAAINHSQWSLPPRTRSTTLFPLSIPILCDTGSIPFGTVLFGSVFVANIQKWSFQAQWLNPQLGALWFVVGRSDGRFGGAGKTMLVVETVGGGVGFNLQPLFPKEYACGLFVNRREKLP